MHTGIDLAPLHITMDRTRTGPHVIIDPGHGGVQPYGSSSPLGCQPAPGLAEKHVTLELAQRVAARLGPLAQLTRGGDVNLSLRERAQLAARSGAQALVSLHANTGAHGLRGSEVWVHERHDPRSAELARELHANLARAGHTRGMFQGPLAVLDPGYVGGAAACLIEADYLSDPQGRDRLTDPRRLDELADAISTGVRNYLGRATRVDPGAGRSSVLGIAHGLPNLTFGPPGPGNRPLGAVVLGATPMRGSPVQIMWTDYNESDTMAGSYWDDVCVVDASGSEVFRDRIRADGLAPGGSQSHYVVWTPQSAGPHTARIRLNTGDYAIPEDRIDDNQSEISTTVWGGRPGYPARLGSGISVREVNGADNLNPRYRSEQNLGSVIFYGYVQPRLDFTNRFIWLVWPMRRRPDDPPASVDIDLRMEIFDQDPQTNPNAAPLDSQLRRISLAEGARFGFEYSRLPPDTTIFIRIQFTDYSQQQDAGTLLWTQAYG